MVESVQLDYVSTQVRNREAFLLNYREDFTWFEGFLKRIEETWKPIGTTRDPQGQSHAGLIPFVNLLVRHAIFGFHALSCYQSYLTWLLFRPGLEALLIIGKFVDDPENANIWKNRHSDRARYMDTFSRNLVSSSIPRSAEFRGVLTRLNDEFTHPNPDFVYRDMTVCPTGTSVVVEAQYFDLSEKIHEAHLLSYLNLLDLISITCQRLVADILGVPISTPSPTYRDKNLLRATTLVEILLSRKIMQELGLWNFHS